MHDATNNQPKQDLSREPFGKLYAKMFTGSMLGAGSHRMAVMSYAIANAKPPSGEVELNPKLLAVLIGDTEERMRDAIEYLQQADENSRTHDEDGRRLIQIGAFKYKLVTWRMHRDGTDYEARRQYWKEQQQKHRKAQELAGENPQTEIPVTGEDKPAKTEPTTRFAKPTLDEVKQEAAAMKLIEGEAIKFWNFYESKGWKVGKSPMKSWKHALAGWKSRAVESQGESVLIHEQPPSPPPQPVRKLPDVFKAEGRTWDVRHKPERKHFITESAFITYSKLYSDWRYDYLAANPALAKQIEQEEVDAALKGAVPA